MNNNPYRTDYHDYLENLKNNLDKADSYVPSGKEYIYDTNSKIEDNVPVKKQGSINLVLKAMIFVVVGVAVVSFLTQGVLFVLDKNQNKNYVVTKSDQENKVLDNTYIKAGLEKEIFEINTPIASTSTEVSTATIIAAILPKKETFDITKYFNVNIPGVSRIGYDERFGNDFLTDNINKYSEKTLVIGQRDNMNDGLIPGGGDESVLIDKYDLIDKAIFPNLNSKAYILADLNTGEIILEKNSDDIYPIASISKLMTAVVATEKMNLQEVAIVSSDATNTYGAQGGLKLGEKIILSDLIFPLLMESSNDAAEVFADHYGHKNFMNEMNKTAALIGMNNTYFNDPSGLDPKNTSNPKDLLKLIRYIWNNNPSIFAATRVKQFSIKGHTWNNRNPQLLINGYIGGKNGYIDQALQTSASVFDIPTFKGGVRSVVLIVLRSNDKNNDVNKLINFMKKYVVYNP